MFKEVLRKIFQGKQTTMSQPSLTGQVGLPSGFYNPYLNQDRFRREAFRRVPGVVNFTFKPQEAAFKDSDTRPPLKKYPQTPD